MAARYSDTDWQKIMGLFAQQAGRFGLPERREQSVVIGSFNIRKLGAIESRSPQSWQLLKAILARFDLVAIQEIMDNLSGFTHLQALLGEDYGMVVSDVTGVKPGESGNPERLGFLFNWKRIQRTALASDITYDRSNIAGNLYEHRVPFADAWDAHSYKLGGWAQKVKAAKATGKRKPSKPPLELPRFLAFIRQPHYVSFKIPGETGVAPYEFLVVNAHLLYGNNKREREWEFLALIEWLTVRAKQAGTLYHPNLLLLGDCNLDFDDDTTVMRDEVDAFIKGLNETALSSQKAATANFPLLSVHPTAGVLRTALRQKQTYDQIGLFAHDQRLPTPQANASAGTQSDGFDYGVFNIGELIAQALHGKGLNQLSDAQRKSIYRKAEYDISDHMPVWMRLPLPQ